MYLLVLVRHFISTRGKDFGTFRGKVGNEVRVEGKSVTNHRV